MRTIGSLFSGIGGLELGLERAGLGTVIWQCEINPFRRQVLKRHWPGATQYHDIQTLSRPSKVDVLCGGFPCQDISDASRGRGGGMQGRKTGLWREFARIAQEIKPHLVIVENVGGAALKKWLPTVRRDLYVLGYRTRAVRIDARDAGAPHRRSRIFVVAYTNRDAQSARAFYAQVARMPAASGLDWYWRKSKPRVLRMDDGLPDGVDRLAALGDAVAPQCAQLLGLLIRSDPYGELAA